MKANNLKYLNKILIVEDNKPIRKLLKASTESNGLEADVAENGLEALNNIDFLSEQGLSYPIISTDLVMPKMDGIELIAKISERFGKGKILQPEMYVLSGGHPRIGEIENIDAYGLIRKHYQKPMSPNQFAKELKEFYDSMRVQ